jgi:hypothetical protein
VAAAVYNLFVGRCGKDFRVDRDAARQIVPVEFDLQRKRLASGFLKPI